MPLCTRCGLPTGADAGPAWRAAATPRRSPPTLARRCALLDSGAVATWRLILATRPGRRSATHRSVVASGAGCQPVPVPAAREHSRVWPHRPARTRSARDRQFHYEQTFSAARPCRRSAAALRAAAATQAGRLLARSRRTARCCPIPGCRGRPVPRCRGRPVPRCWPIRPDRPDPARLSRSGAAPIRPSRPVTRCLSVLRQSTEARGGEGKRPTIAVARSPSFRTRRAALTTGAGAL